VTFGGVEALCSSVVFAPPDCRAKRRKIDKGGVMKTRTTLAFLIALACTAYAAEVGAQVVRESDVKSIAGVVYKGGEPVGFNLQEYGRGDSLRKPERGHIPPLDVA